MSCCLHRKLDIFPACLPLGLQAASYGKGGLGQHGPISPLHSRGIVVMQTQGAHKDSREFPAEATGVPAQKNLTFYGHVSFLERTGSLIKQLLEKKEGGLFYSKYSGAGTGIIHLWKMPLMFTEQYKWKKARHYQLLKKKSLGMGSEE